VAANFFKLPGAQDLNRHHHSTRNWRPHGNWSTR